MRSVKYVYVLAEADRRITENVIASTMYSCLTRLPGRRVGKPVDKHNKDQREELNIYGV